MRIAVVSNPALGHVLPLLPLATAARDAGHDVVVLAGSSVAAAVAGAGLRQVTTASPDLPSVLARIPERRGLTGRRLALATWTHGFAGVLATELADAVLGLARDWPPDLVLHEDSEQGSWIAAERLGIPHVALQATAWRSTVQRASRKPLGRLLERHGLPPDPELARWHRYAFLATRPQALRDPADPMPATTSPIRPVAADESVAATPDWVSRPESRRVCVTMGTMPLAADAVMPWVADAFRGLDAEVVVTLGPSANPAILGTPPANVRLVSYVPMSRLLPTCAAVVFHAGSGTMLAALSAGVPLVLLPVAADQPDNADRCAAAGAGVVVGGEEREAASVRDALERVLADRAFADAARRVADEIEVMPEPATVLPLLVRLADGAVADAPIHI
jgi:UDP:flavonoid glycosyltransferase YjiC (YdhE family)